MAPISQREHDLRRLRGLLRTVLRGLWQRRRPRLEIPGGIGSLRLGPRHLAILAHVGSEGPRTVGEIAEELGLSLPAVSKLTRELEDAALVRRSEHIDDRRRTVVDLNALTAKQVRGWLDERNRPLAAALDALTAEERAAFLKGLAALADALLRESARGSLRPDDRPPHRRRAHRHRPV
jgi:DNA-binding MarR family transcriptional regulator